MTDFLFVYGTLNPKKGILQQLGIDHEIIGKGKVKGKLLQKTEYPALIPATINESESIPGIVIKLSQPQKAWNKLDHYEEFFPNNINHSLYVRKKTHVIMKNNELRLCWIYWYNFHKKQLLNKL